MDETNIKSRYRGLDRRAPHTGTVGAVGVGERFGNPLKRGPKVGGRHAAITTDLYSWHNYKNWADKMRGSWEEKK